MAESPTPASAPESATRGLLAGLIRYRPGSFEPVGILWAEITNDPYGRNLRHIVFENQPYGQWTLCGRKPREVYPSNKNDSISMADCGTCKRIVLERSQ